MTRIFIYAGAALATGAILYLGITGGFTGTTQYITRMFTKKDPLNVAA
jgi:hypothetical protein